MFGLESWQFEAMGQLVLAAALGGAIGLEREYHGRAAGFRTHLLVCVGSCLVMILSLHFERIFGGKSANTAVRVDPARLAYSVMGGIGFLGAGAIIKSGVTIRGLTTAASLWCIAAIGMACGFATYALALFTGALVLFSLFALNSIERYIEGHWYKVIRVTCEDRPDEIEKVAQILEAGGVRILDVDFDRNVREHTVTITYNVRFRERAMTSRIYRTLSERGGLTSIRVE
jgi:putative Mg2+ transporter-C (MgtC) family protein